MRLMMRRATDEKSFRRATDLHLTIGFLDQSGALELGEQNSVGFHFEQIYLLLEKATKLPLQDWAPVVCEHMGKIEIVDKVDPRWRDKLEAIVRSMAEERLAKKGQTPAWLAYSILENLASLRIFLLRREREIEKYPDHIFNTIYRTAEQWILEDVSPTLARKG